MNRVNAHMTTKHMFELNLMWGNKKQSAAKMWTLPPIAALVQVKDKRGQGQIIIIIIVIMLMKIMIIVIIMMMIIIIITIIIKSNFHSAFQNQQYSHSIVYTQLIVWKNTSKCLYELYVHTFLQSLCMSLKTGVKMIQKERRIKPSTREWLQNPGWCLAVLLLHCYLSRNMHCSHGVA